MVYYCRTRSCRTRHPSRGTSTAWSTTPGLVHVGPDTPDSRGTSTAWSTSPGLGHVGADIPVEGQPEPELPGVDDEAVEESPSRPRSLRRSFLLQLHVDAYFSSHTFFQQLEQGKLDSTFYSHLRTRETRENDLNLQTRFSLLEWAH